MELLAPNKIKQTKQLIIVASIAIPVVVALLFGIKIDGIDLSFLPGIYAGINALTAVVLIISFWAIKNQKRELHRSLMRFALLLSLLFLVLYVAYHITSDPTVYGDSNGDGTKDILERSQLGFDLYVYYFFLITHVTLSIAVVPLVLFSYLYAWQGDYERHKKWTRFTFPIGLDVAITGVIVYFMIAPYF